LGGQFGSQARQVAFGVAGHESSMMGDFLSRHCKRVVAIMLLLDPEAVYVCVLAHIHAQVDRVALGAGNFCSNRLGREQQQEAGES
jgi:hypothetical protein